MTIVCQTVNVANLIINSTPTGARIWLGPHLGTLVDQGVNTSSSFILTAGDYDIQLVLAGYQYYTQTVTVSASALTTVDAVLTPDTGSVTISSTPSGAEIWLGPHLGTLTYQGTTSPGGTTISGLAPGSYDYKLILAGYADATGTFTAISGSTISIPVTMLTSANITATNITVTLSQTPCMIGTCTVTIVVRWSNSGQTDGTVIPNIKIDNVSQTPHASRTVPAGGFIEETFTVTGLSAAAHTACPDPNY